MQGLPKDNYQITILSPHLFKAAAKYKAEKREKQTGEKNDNTALTSSLDVLSMLGRSDIQKMTPEQRKELLIKAYTAQTAADLTDRYGLDEDSVPFEEIEDMIRTSVEEAETELKSAIGDAVNKHIEEHPECVIKLEDLEKTAGEDSAE